MRGSSAPPPSLFLFSHPGRQAPSPFWFFIPDFSFIVDSPSRWFWAEKAVDLLHATTLRAIIRKPKTTKWGGV